MNCYLRGSLRAARLRWIPRAHLFGEQHREPRGAAHPSAASSQHVEELSSMSSWGVIPIGHRYQLRSYSAAAARRRYTPVVDEEEEEDKRLRQLEKRRVFRAAQRAFQDYLHFTRGLSFGEAENISKHSRVFVTKLLEMVKDAMEDPVEGGGETVFRSKEKKKDMRDQRVSNALQRLFRYHPINEFEPFFESIGLKPNVFDSLLPRKLMFLADDNALLENYRILCNYGVGHTNIGRIYRDAPEVFSFGQNVLAFKLRALEDLGFSKTSVIKLVISSPVVLAHDPNAEFKVLKWLDDAGIERNWIGQFLSLKMAYNWRMAAQVPQFFSDLGFNKEGIGKLLRKNPDFLLDGSGKELFKAVNIMIKAGSGKQDLFNLFLDFPNVRARNFTRNIVRGVLFLTQINVCEEDVKKFVVSNALMLGSAPVKSANSITTNLSVGKRRLCKMIMDEPCVLLNYTYGKKLSRLEHPDRNDTSLKEKVKFLERIGFVEGSEDMKKALKVFRGKGDELQDRFDFLVKIGFDPKDVTSMIKVAPHVLNQKTNVLESKISFFLNETGYPLSAVVGFPSFLSFTIERTKSRFLMYNWLQERGLAPPKLALSTLLACSETNFVKYLVQKHKNGSEVWENFKREVASTKNMSCTSDE